MVKSNELKLANCEPFTIARTFDAPRDAVWKAWTDRDQLARWFGPKGVTIVQAKLDLRIGGSLHSCMRTPDGKDMWGKWAITELVPPERLVYINSFSDANGGLTRHPMSPTWPLEMLTTVTLTAQGKQTLLNLAWLPVNATPEEIKTFEAGRAGMSQGWGGSFDQLAASLAGNKRS